DDVEHALVRAGLVLVARVLVDVRRGQHGVALDLGRQRDRAAHLRAGPLGRLDDLAGRAVDQAMIEGLQPNPDLLVRHGEFLSPKSEGPAAGCAGPREMLVLPTTCKNKGRPVARPARGMLHTRKRAPSQVPRTIFRGGRSAAARHFPAWRKRGPSWPHFAGPRPALGGRPAGSRTF